MIFEALSVLHPPRSHRAGFRLVHQHQGMMLAIVHLHQSIERVHDRRLISEDTHERGLRLNRATTRVKSNIDQAECATSNAFIPFSTFLLSLSHPLSEPHQHLQLYLRQHDEIRAPHVDASAAAGSPGPSFLQLHRNLAYPTSSACAIFTRPYHRMCRRQLFT